MSNRIKLAEAMGWKHVAMRQKCGGHLHLSGLGPDESIFSRITVPDPENDANDCEALIGWLNRQGRDVEISHWHDSVSGSTVSVDSNDIRLPHEWEGDNWKEGVCELALKVIAAHSDQPGLDDK